MQKTYNGTLYLIRGCSGSGKSTFAKELLKILSAVGDKVVLCEADDFFMVDGKYLFDEDKLKEAHRTCAAKAYHAMKSKETNTVIVSNTNTRESEFKEYLEMANIYNYRILSLVVENRHGGENSHGVSDGKLKAQATRLRSTLKLIP